MGAGAGPARSGTTRPLFYPRRVPKNRRRPSMTADRKLDNRAGRASDPLRNFGLGALGVGILGLFASVLWVWRTQGRAEFFQAYLWAFLFYCGIALGCLSVLMLSHLTGGLWGRVSRPIL